MDVYEAIFARRTVRDFQDREIDLESIERILDAGLHAPTNNHLREWEFVIVNDKSARLKLIDRARKSITDEHAPRIKQLSIEVKDRMHFDAW